jgi:DNA-binding NtrC family response regulator
MDIFLPGYIKGIKSANTIWYLSKITVIYLPFNADISTVKQAKYSVFFGDIINQFKVQYLQATIEIALSKYQEQSQEQHPLKNSYSLKEEAKKLSLVK